MPRLLSAYGVVGSWFCINNKSLAVLLVLDAEDAVAGECLCPAKMGHAMLGRGCLALIRGCGGGLGLGLCRRHVLLTDFT